MKLQSCVLAGLGGLLLFAAATPAITFTSSFESIKIDARPGEVVNRDFKLHLAATGSQVHFKSRAEDWWASEDGSQSFYRRAGTLPRSCGPWISLNPVETAVAPGGVLSIRVTAAIPRHAGPGGYWCVLTVDEVPDPLDDSQGVAIRFQTSVSVGIFINLAPVVRNAEIREIEISQGKARLRVCNRGNTPVGAEGRVEFLPLGGPRSGQASPVATAIVPRATVLLDPAPCRILKTELPGSSALPPGRYLVRVVLDIGIDHYIGLQREMEIGGDLLPPAQSH